MNPLTSANQLFAPFFTDAEAASLFSTVAFTGHFMAFERALALALRDQGHVSDDVAQLALDRMDSFHPDYDAIATAMQRDGMPVPEFMRQIKRHAGSEAAAAIHIGTTSHDVIDTAIILAIKRANDLLTARLTGLQGQLTGLNARFGGVEIMGRTRMQAALPIQLSTRITSWAAPIRDHLTQLKDSRPALEVVQFGGPVGNLSAFGPQGEAFRSQMAQELGLGLPTESWHVTRGRLVNYANWLSLVSGSLGKIGQDIAMMSQQGMETIRLSNGGTSSAMAHKQNPILAETLVSLARFNATQLGAMHQALIQEQERSGAAWTLEWIILPGMINATAKALEMARNLLDQITDMGPQNG